MNSITSYCPLLGRIVLGAILLAGSSPSSAAEPARKFPDTTDTIRVFADQFGGDTTPAQRHFAATRYVGTQKLLAEQIRQVRKYNPRFIMLQYRLATRVSPPPIIFIHKNKWTNDWEEIDRHEDWFYHTGDRPPKRVFMPQGKTVEYIMDISGRINGNIKDGFKEYWARTVIADLKASEADGVFADAAMPPYGVPAEFYHSRLGPPPYISYLDHLQTYYSYAYQELDKAGFYFIPNIGYQNQGWDTMQGYFNDVHGAMVEGFGLRGSRDDWKLQQNNVLKLLRNGKIYIAQTAVPGPEDVQGRLWYLANFLLLKHHRSYVNIIPKDNNLYWWPEYDLKLGPPIKIQPPMNIDDLWHPAGVYFRFYRNGLVMVNPSDLKRSIPLAGDPKKFQVVVPWGGGIIDRDARVPRGGLKLEPAEARLTVAPWSGVILLRTETGH